MGVPRVSLGGKWPSSSTHPGTRLGSDGADGGGIGWSFWVKLKFCRIFWMVLKQDLDLNLVILCFSLDIWQDISRFVKIYQDDYWCDPRGPEIFHDKFWRRHRRHQEERTPTWLGTSVLLALLALSWKWMLRYSPFDNIIFQEAPIDMSNLACLSARINSCKYTVTTHICTHCACSYKCQTREVARGFGKFVATEV